MQPTRVLGVDQDSFASGEALAAGALLNGGNYVVERSLGQGGFGITYLAKDLQLERYVVIKECFPESICYRDGLDLAVRSPSHGPHFSKCVEMFVREARSIARLSHPNIVNVYAIFEENKTAYMVLDLIDGADLLDIIEEHDRTFTPDEIELILTDILSALTVVHDQNLLHRDISPDNILLSDSGRPTLIDFGSAREFASERTRVNTSLLFVKDGYSPFEFYVSGAAHSPASDLYALGGTIYHLVAGEAPPSSQFRSAELQAERPDPCVPLAGRFEGYKSGFLESVDKALSLVPSKRIQTTRDWLKLLATNDVVRRSVTETPSPQQPTSLGELVSQTNKEVLGAQPVARPEPVRLDEYAVDLGQQPVWRDEFNRETEELLAKAELTELDDAEDSEIFETVEAIPEPQEQVMQGRHAAQQSADVRSAQSEIAAYYQAKDTRKSRRRRSGNPGPLYIFIGFFVVILASFIAVNQERMKEDGSWTVVFSLQGFCRSDFFQTYSPIEISCEGRQDVRRIDLNDRDMILQLNKNVRTPGSNSLIPQP